MTATERQKRWAWGVAQEENGAVEMRKLFRHVTVIRSRCGFGWRLVGNLGEEYARGWARHRATARRAGEIAKQEWEEKDKAQKQHDTVDSRNGQCSQHEDGHSKNVKKG